MTLTVDYQQIFDVTAIPLMVRDIKTTANYDRREIKEMRKAAGSLHFPLSEK